MTRSSRSFDYYFSPPVPLTTPYLSLLQTSSSASTDPNLDVSSQLTNSDDERPQHNNFPDTIGNGDQFVEVAEDLSAPTTIWQDARGDSLELSLMEEVSQAAVSVRRGEMEDFNVLFWNCSGYRLSRTHLDLALDRYNIAVCALNETWWKWPLNRFDFECANFARSP